MKKQTFAKIKFFSAGIVTILIFSSLFWEHFHEGVTSHHILQQQNLPSISNWWGGLLLPILTWFLLSRIEKRLIKKSSQTQETDKNKFGREVISLFLSGLVLGVLISISFMNEFKPFLDNVLYIVILISFIIPIFYAEFILGFILGMTYTFGAILPTAFILIFAVIGIVSYRFIRPTILSLIRRF
jgi:uncharacterized protein YacL